jgi:leader peptidase (prepilin peptidase)/N-methyltransferase
MLYQQIPDIFTILLFVSSLPIAFVLREEISLTTRFMGAGLVFSWFSFQWLWTKGKAVGSGDIFLGAAIGFLLGLFGAVTMLLLSYMTGAVIVLFLLLIKKVSFKKERIAFGPFMGIATLLTLLGAGEAYVLLL